MVVRMYFVGAVTSKKNPNRNFNLVWRYFTPDCTSNSSAVHGNRELLEKQCRMRCLIIIVILKNMWVLVELLFNSMLDLDLQLTQHGNIYVNIVVGGAT